MKCLVLFVICTLSFAAFPLGGDMLRLPERLSLSFKEFSVGDDGSLHVTLDEFWGARLFVGIGSDEHGVPFEPGRIFSVKFGDILHYHYSGAPGSSLRVYAGDDPEMQKVGLPAQMRNERHYLRIRTNGVEAYVGIDSQKAYIPGEKTWIDFPLPFKTVWTDREDFRLWSSGGGGCRGRLKKVGIVSEGEKQLADDLFRHFSATNLADLVGGSCVAGTTNVQVAASDVPGNVVPGLVGSLFVQIDGTNAQLRVSGFSFVTQDGECRRARRYRLDFRGRLTWGWRVDRANENGTPGRTVLDMPFEYDAEGVLRRAWTQGSNPLMIDKGDKLYFVGDRDLLIQFREEAFRALDGLPWQK